MCDSCAEVILTITVDKGGCSYLDRKIAFISLGCDKNRVDSEVMLGLVSEKGYVLTGDEAVADVIVINTCAFIHDAKEESIETILEMAEYKKTGNCKALIVTGCLAQRYQGELMQELPEVDAIVGTTGYDSIVEVIEGALSNNKVMCLKDIHTQPDPYIHRIISTTGYYAYLKIAEGCNKSCTFCIIPKLRGKIRSRTIESLVEEAKYLALQGVKELIIVAQDTTMYGIDIYHKKALPDLLRALVQVEAIEWIRLLYCYPETITDELIQVMQDENKICNYIDMPIQHINDTILNKMARKSTKNQITNTLHKLREAIPDICLRTTLITGFPGETEEQFQEMCDFIEKTEFDHLGVFTFSPEEGTKAAKMDNQIKEAIKIKRQEVIMTLQQAISLKKHKEQIGRILDVLIEGYIPEDNVYCGRTYRDTPNVDGMIFITSPYEHLSGDRVKAQIIGANEYDLIGEIIHESRE